jgi:GntR family transcriptional repressor for pyruvate dehydrogenase complex
MQLKRITKTRISDRVIEQLVSLISTGKIRPGEKLPSELELTHQFDVGRSTVREALRALALAGMVDAKPKRGTFVTSALAKGLGSDLAHSVAYWAIRDLYEVRILLEAHAAELAAQMATAEQISAIESSHIKIIDQIANGVSYFKTNIDFHVNIARCSRNGALVQCISSIIGSYREMREQINHLESVPQEDLDDHAEIIKAIKSKDAVEARKLMRVHLQHTIAKLEHPKDVA